MNSEDERVEWLRGQIESDLALAREAADGDSGAWFSGDKWNVYRAEDEARFDPDTMADEHRLVVYGNVKPQSEHIARHDPRDAGADCEAKLALLAGHGDEHMCFGSGHDGNSWEWFVGDCKVMTALAGAYRHRDGYAEHWGSASTPEASSSSASPRTQAR